MRDGRYSLIVIDRNDGKQYPIIGEFENPSFGVSLSHKMILKETNIIEKIDIVTSVYQNKEAFLNILKERGFIPSTFADVIIKNSQSGNNKEVIYNNVSLRGLAKSIVITRMQLHKQGKKMKSGVLGRNIPSDTKFYDDFNKLKGSFLRELNQQYAPSHFFASNYSPKYNNSSPKEYQVYCETIKELLENYCYLTSNFKYEECRVVKQNLDKYLKSYVFLRGTVLWQNQFEKDLPLIQQGFLGPDGKRKKVDTEHKKVVYQCLKEYVTEKKGRPDICEGQYYFDLYSIDGGYYIEPRQQKSIK